MLQTKKIRGVGEGDYWLLATYKETEAETNLYFTRFVAHENLTKE